MEKNIVEGKAKRRKDQGQKRDRKGAAHVDEGGRTEEIAEEKCISRILYLNTLYTLGEFISTCACTPLNVRVHEP